MRRANAGAMRHLPTRHPGEGGGVVRPAPAESPTPRTLSRISVVPVIMAGSEGQVAALEDLIGASSLLRVAAPVEAKNLGRRGLGADVDVLLIDARRARPSVVYRAIVRARNAGWERGIVLMLDAEDLAIVPVASSIGD